MKQILSLLVMLGLAISGVEGAVDAVDVEHTGSGSGSHEVHHQHPADGTIDIASDVDGDGDGQPDRDPDGHAHVCHCGLHLPPMAFTTVFSMTATQDTRIAFIDSPHTFLAEPPPLRPPIA